MRDRLSGNEKLLLLCNPQNPGGTVYRRDELLQHHQFARKHDLIVCSDEIHCELLLEPGVRHTPFATLNDDAAQRSVTLMSPSKRLISPGWALHWRSFPTKRCDKG